MARYGGEEFVVVMPGTGPEEAVAAIERPRATVEAIDFQPIAGTRSYLTVSAGVAFTQAETVLPEILIQAADAALYQGEA